MLKRILAAAMLIVVLAATAGAQDPVAPAVNAPAVVSAPEAPPTVVLSEATNLAIENYLLLYQVTRLEVARAEAELARRRAEVDARVLKETGRAWDWTTGALAVDAKPSEADKPKP